MQIGGGVGSEVSWDRRRRGFDSLLGLLVASGRVSWVLVSWVGFFGLVGWWIGGAGFVVADRRC